MDAGGTYGWFMEAWRTAATLGVAVKIGPHGRFVLRFPTRHPP